jgi:hypothetical protein
MGITPTCAPSALISRTSGTLICSLILTLCCFWMAVTSCIGKDIYKLMDNLYFVCVPKVLLFPPP